MPGVPEKTLFKHAFEAEHDSTYWRVALQVPYLPEMHDGAVSVKTAHEDTFSGIILQGARVTLCREKTYGGRRPGIEVRKGGFFDFGDKQKSLGSMNRF